MFRNIRTLLCFGTAALSPAYCSCLVTFRVLDPRGSIAPYAVKSFQDRDGKDHATAFDSLRGEVPCGGQYRYELNRIDVRNGGGSLRGILAVEHSTWRTLTVPHNLVVTNGIAGTIDGGGIDYNWRGRVEGENVAGLWIHLQSTLENYKFETEVDDHGNFSIYERPYAGEYLLYITDRIGRIRYSSTLRVTKPGPSIPLIVKLTTGELPVRSVE